MITANNYFVEMGRIGVDNLPDTLKETHEYVVQATKNGSNWDKYHKEKEIKEVIDLYLKALNEFLQSSKKTKSERSNAQPKAKKYKAKEQVKTDHKKPGSAIKKSQKVSQSNSKPAKKVEHIREEVKFIKRFVALHNKVKSPDAILSFIKSLQRAIVQKLIRKTSPLAKQIEVIQDRLIHIYNKMKGDAMMNIDDKELSKLVAIAGGERVYPSINIMKRYIGLQGKEVETKTVERFIKQIENALENRKVAENDPYIQRVKAIYSSLKKKAKGETYSISKAELNGLEGIVKDCTCKKDLGFIYRIKKQLNIKGLRKCRKKTSYSDAKGKGTCSHNGGLTGLSGVLTAEQMANRKLDVLNFFSIWLTLFGNPAKNFTMMFHGEPHNGKTILLLKFAQFLAEHFGRVLFVSSEEFASTTMSKKVNEFLKPFPSRLAFVGNLKDADLSQYDFIILDSVNDLGLKVNEYKTLREQYPHKAFILILQHTKGGTFKGAKDWEHIAEIVGEVEKGVITVSKNRYGPKSVFDFFQHFGLQWEEPQHNVVSNMKPYPVQQDMMTGDNNHY